MAIYKKRGLNLVCFWSIAKHFATKTSKSPRYLREH